MHGKPTRDTTAFLKGGGEAGELIRAHDWASTPLGPMEAWPQSGPPVVEPSGPGGYGSKLLERAMTRQLDGSINRQWDEAGVVVTLTMNKAYLIT